MAVRKIKGSWWVDFQRAGQRYRLRSPDNRQASAIAYERTLLRKLADGDEVFLSQDPRAAASRMGRTFEEFAKDWFTTYVQANLKPSTQTNYAKILHHTLVPFFGRHNLAAITVVLIERFKAVRLRTGVVAKTVNNDLFVLCKLLRTAHDWGLTKSSPRIQFLKSEPSAFDYLTVEESVRLLENMREPKWSLFFLLALRTGLRAGELIGLRWEDLDFARRVIVVRRSVVRGVVGSTKSNRIRYVKMAEDLRDRLASGRTKATGYLFTGRGEEPVTLAMAQCALLRAMKRAGLRKIGLHTLRHTFASQLAMEGVPLLAIQMLLGHSTPVMTQRYAHLAPSFLGGVVDVLPQAHARVASRLRQLAVNQDEQEANCGQLTADPTLDFSAEDSKDARLAPNVFAGRNDRD